jgi:D-cysteine desulfhydrase
MKELVNQNVNPDWIIFGTSSGGTHAGIVLGQRLFGFKGKALGISIDESVADLKKNVSALATQASEKLGERIEFTGDDVLANDDYCQAGYGVFGDGEREAIKLFASNEGLLLDPVYTGRAAAGMIDLIRKGYFKQDETVLFWHTGGQPALFADKYSQEVIRE